jgi:hypothetical protein
MNSSDLVAQRLRNQKLSSAEFRQAADVVRWFGAVQAQDLNGAKWALALRMRSVTHDEIQEAYNAGKIIRTHVMRPTWHFVAADDIRWLLALTAPRVNVKAGPYYRKYELDAATFKRSTKAVTKALQGGTHLTRRDLKVVLNQAGVAADDPVRLGHILLRAELDGVVCSGPMSGNQITYALLEERVPPTKALDRDEALAKLTRRFFTSHGPATLRDFVWWSGLTVGDVRRGVALAGRDLKETLIEDKTYHTPRSVQRARRSECSAHLLPAFDEYLVAYQDRSAVSDLNGLLGPTVIVDGRVAGTWKHTKNDKSIDVQPMRALTNAERLAIAKASQRLERFKNQRPGRT